MIFTLGESTEIASSAIETEEPECEWDHVLTPLSIYKNQPFALGSFLEYGQNTKKPNRAEMFDLNVRKLVSKLFPKIFDRKFRNPFKESGFKCQNFHFIQICTVSVHIEL